IYNYPTLRRDLELRGHTFRTNSDTETIVHLYEDSGESCFEKLHGMFAIALWDSRKDLLFLARDRIGIKPLFFGTGDDGICFGSEIKAVQAWGLCGLELDASSIADLFTFFYIPAPKTIYKNVRSVNPGTYLRVNRDGVYERRYWDLKYEPLSFSSER